MCEIYNITKTNIYCNTVELAIIHGTYTSSRVCGCILHNSYRYDNNVTIILYIYPVARKKVHPLARHHQIK